MRAHDHAHDHDIDAEPSLRPKAARLDDPASFRLQRAAVAGRADVLGGSGVLDLQRAVGNAATGALLDGEHSPVRDVVGSGGGCPLAPDVREDMESQLGHDFGDVCVHTDPRAHESARAVGAVGAVGAHAYTVGSDVVFQRDRYNPSSTEGRTILAHELTHVVQRPGVVDGTPALGRIRVSDPSDRFERKAVATAERAMSAPGPAAVTSAKGPAVQREEAPEEDESQRMVCESTPPVRRTGPEDRSWRELRSGVRNTLDEPASLASASSPLRDGGPLNRTMMIALQRNGGNRAGPEPHRPRRTLSVNSRWLRSMRGCSSA